MDYKGTEVRPVFSNYVGNGNLALQLVEEGGIPYGVVTVNLVNETIEENQGFIDTNNFGGYYIVKWLEKNGFGEDTGLMGTSGFCTYPLFEFNKEVIEKYKVNK